MLGWDEAQAEIRIAGRNISNLRYADDITLMAEKASLVAQTVKRLPTMQETQVQSLGWEDPLGEEMATHSSILPGESRGQRSLVGYSPQGRKESDTAEHSNRAFRRNLLMP